MTDQTIPSHEFDPQPEEGEKGELLDAFVEDVPRLLSDDQARRVEALHHAFGFLTAYPGEPRVLIPADQFPAQLTYVADYILSGGEEYPQMPVTITVPDEVVHLVRSLNVEQGVIVLPASAGIVDLGEGF